VNSYCQFRVLEAVLASLIIVSAFIVSTQLGRMARMKSISPSTLLADEAFSLISQLCDSGMLDSILSSKNEDGLNPEAEFDALLRAFLRPGTAYKAMIYEVDMSSGYPRLISVFEKPVTNIPEGSEPPEMISIKYFYTSVKSGKMYLIVLSIGRD